MKPDTIALAGLSLTMIVASWGSRRNGDTPRDFLAMVTVTALLLIGTLASVFF
jgi:hypothetical protein